MKWLAAVASVLFLASVLLLPTSIPAKAEPMPKWINDVVIMWVEKKITDKEFSDAFQYLSDKKIISISGSDTEQISDYRKHQNKITDHYGVKKYFVYAEPVPVWAPSAKDSVAEAINFWQSHTDVQFSYADSIKHTTVIIKWIKEADGPYAGYVINGKIIEIGLGDSDCGKWQPYDTKFLSSLVKHELGHAIGFQHNSDQNNIMHQQISFPRYDESSGQSLNSNCFDNTH